MRTLSYCTLAVLACLCVAGVATAADQTPTSAPVKQQPDGMWVDKTGTPTYKISKDGTLDWYTFDGFLQYSANCLQCHGPDGMGSSYAPSLVDALKTMSYGEFLGTVAGGKKSVSTSQDLVMPSFGLNKNVMCYINPIYLYLKARAAGAVGRGRPQKHAPVTPGFNKEVDSCMG